MAAGIVAIGTSWGGLAAVGRILSALPPDFPVPIVVVQHRSRESNRFLAELLQDTSDLKVQEAEDKDVLAPAKVYVAPSDYHLLVDSAQVSLTIDEPVRYSRPSIDVTFSSIAESYGSGAIGVVLTGANQDGARGLARIIALAGRGLVQDPDTAEVPIMPAAAKRAAPSAEVLPLEEIGPRLVEMLRAGEPSRRKAG